MIILLAMINSLAASENAPRGAMAPLDRAAWGVYVGDGKIGDWGGKRRRGALFSPVTAKRPRRLSGGRRGVDLPSGHRQPETKRASHAALQGAPGGAVVTTSIRAGPPALIWQVLALPFARDFRADASPRMESGKPLGGSTTRPRPVCATRRPSSDGPGQTPHSTVERAGCTNSVRIRNAL
jgi:hypothetical protein